MSTVVYIGNFRPDHSTENDVRHALTELDVTVVPVQEDDWIAGRADVPPPDDVTDPIMLLWTRTWPAPRDRATDAVAAWQTAGLPVVGYHLDVWWGLRRQTDIYTDPYFRSLDVFVSADGSPAAARRYAAADVNHLWMPPAVSTRHPWHGNRLPQKWPEFVVFVGNEQYHDEWPHRTMMVQQLRKRYGHRFVSLPGRGRPAYRGQDLADIYATAAVVVGDSCFAGVRPRYWSDRIPETLARGGLLVHPDLDFDGEYQAGAHLSTWNLGDWAGLFAEVDTLLEWNDEDRDSRRARARRHVSQHHTYTRRMTVLLEEVTGQWLS